MTETPFIDFALDAVRNTRQIDTPECAALLALAARAEKDARTAHGVPRAYSTETIARDIRRAESTTRGYLQLLVQRGVVEKIGTGLYRPMEVQ